MDEVDIFSEMTQQLEILDQQQALLQAQAYLSHRYIQWCDACLDELDQKRASLVAIITEWQHAEQCYKDV